MRSEPLLAMDTPSLVDAVHAQQSATPSVRYSRNTSQESDL